MSRKAKHNPGGSLLWLVAGAAGVYVLYQMMKPSEASAAEPASDTSTTPPEGGAGLVEDSTGLKIIDAIPDFTSTVPATPSGTAEPLTPAPEVVPSTTTTGGGTTTTGGGSGGSQGGGRRPIPRFEPQGGGSGSSGWVSQAQIYVPPAIQGLVSSVRSAKNDPTAVSLMARSFGIPKYDEFAVFVTRASGMSSVDRGKAAKVLIALVKNTSMTQADQSLADSRLRTLAAVEWAAVNQSKPDMSRLKYLYDRTNSTIKYDPVKLAKAANSQTTGGSGNTGSGTRVQLAYTPGGRGR